MFEYIPIEKQLIKERSKNLQNANDNARNAANIDYIAMMCDIELSEHDPNTESLEPEI